MSFIRCRESGSTACKPVESNAPAITNRGTTISKTYGPASSTQRCIGRRGEPGSAAGATDAAVSSARIVTGFVVQGIGMARNGGTLSAAARKRRKRPALPLPPGTTRSAPVTDQTIPRIRAACRKSLFALGSVSTRFSRGFLRTRATALFAAKSDSPAFQSAHDRTNHP